MAKKKRTTPRKGYYSPVRSARRERSRKWAAEYNATSGPLTVDQLFKLGHTPRTSRWG